MKDIFDQTEKSLALFLFSFFLSALFLAAAPAMPAHARPVHDFALNQAKQTEQARRWLPSIYANLRAHGPGTSVMRSQNLYAPSLLALFSANQKAHDPDEVPYLDGDIFCDCQEADVHDVRIDLRPPGHARRHVRWDARVSRPPAYPAYRFAISMKNAPYA